jgi:glycosyltransferase involved in cell wall biosynthesis
MNRFTSFESLSVIMPVYNEVATVRAAVARVRSLKLDLEIVCVDDGSTDGSREVLNQLLAAKQIDQLLVHERNQGKGAAVRWGIRQARGQIIVVQDADLEYDPRELPLLLQPILEGRADAVFGSRFLDRSAQRLGRWHRLVNSVLTRLSNFATELRLTDMETGYKMVRSPLLQQLTLHSCRFGIEPELTARLAQAGARVVEVPITYRRRSYAQGKKIGWRDGVAALWHIFRASRPPERFRVAPPSPHVVEGERPGHTGRQWLRTA